MTLRGSNWTHAHRGGKVFKFLGLVGFAGLIGLAVHGETARKQTIPPVINTEIISPLTPKDAIEDKGFLYRPVYSGYVARMKRNGYGQNLWTIYGEREVSLKGSNSWELRDEVMFQDIDTENMIEKMKVLQWELVKNFPTMDGGLHPDYESFIRAEGQKYNKCDLSGSLSCNMADLVSALEEAKAKTAAKPGARLKF
jgi:hypothetical protein